MTLSDHKASGGFCECCGVPFPCSTARRAVESWLGRVRSTDLMTPAETPGERRPVARDRAHGALARIPLARTSPDNEADARGSIRPGS
jgi:hypothetical protein